MNARNRLLTIVVPWAVLLVFLMTSPVILSAAAPISMSLKDGDKCKKGEDCTCVHVKCNVGCTCTITVGLGICTHCPIPEVPAAAGLTAVPLPLELVDRLVRAAQKKNATGEELIGEAVLQYLDREAPVAASAAAGDLDCYKTCVTWCLAHTEGNDRTACISGCAVVCSSSVATPPSEFELELKRQ